MNEILDVITSKVFDFVSVLCFQQSVYSHIYLEICEPSLPQYMNFVNLVMLWLVVLYCLKDC